MKKLMIKGLVVFSLSLFVVPTANAQSNQAPEYHKANPPKITSVIPPKDFNPLNATDEELKKFHIPEKPKDPHKLKAWNEAMSHAKTFISPELKIVPDHKSDVVSKNQQTWSGYEDVDTQTNNFTGVTAEWTIPDVSASDSSIDSYSCNWIGLGGDNEYFPSNSGLIQAGTEQDDLQGSTNYYFWYELLPDYQYQVLLSNMSATPGDLVYVNISYSGGNSYYFIEDATTGIVANFTVSNSSGDYSGTTAEFITERTEENSNRDTYLADFGSTAYTYCDASNNSNSYSIGEWSSKSSNNEVFADTMYNSLSTYNTLASPSSLYTSGATGDSFVINFQNQK